MTESLPPKPKASFARRNAGKFVASAIITVSIWLMMRKGGLAIVPEGGSFSQVKWWVVGVYLVIYSVMNYFRAVRWRYLLRSFAEIPRKRILIVSLVGFAAIILMPFRLGEFVRPYMIREKGRVSLSSATGTIVAERVVDGLFLSIVLAIALITVPTISPLPDRVVGIPVSVAHVRDSGFVMFAAFVIGFIGLVVFYFARAWSKKMTLLVFGVVSKNLAAKLAETAEKMANGLHFLGRMRDAIPFLLETAIYWGINAFGMWILAWGCGVTHADGTAITFGEACALMGMLGVTILIPGPPGLLGVFQAGIYAGMTMYFPTDIVTGPGAAYVFLLYASQVGWTMTAGGICLIVDQSALRKLQQAEREESEGVKSTALPS